VRIPQTLPAPPAPGQPVEFDMKDVEVWRNGLSAFSSSPIIVGDRIYTVTETGELCAINAETGQIFWREKIGIEQRNSSLVHAEGRLYVPMLDDPEAKGSEAGTRGAFYIFKPSDTGLEKLTHLSLE